MAIISIENMEFYAYHGCFEEEQKIGTRFQVDLNMEVDTSLSENSDNLNDTVDYLAVYQSVKDEMMKPSKLLEHLARRILNRVGRDFANVKYARVKVKKMNPPWVENRICSSRIRIGIKQTYLLLF